MIVTIKSFINRHIGYFFLEECAIIFSHQLLQADTHYYVDYPDLTRKSNLETETVIWRKQVPKSTGSFTQLLASESQM